MVAYVETLNKSVENDFQGFKVEKGAKGAKGAKA
jgi:hypothetical protein